MHMTGEADVAPVMPLRGYHILVQVSQYSNWLDVFGD
jgi:hypothetical protein